MKIFIARIFTLLSLASLLVVVQVGVRTYELFYTQSSFSSELELPSFIGLNEEASSNKTTDPKMAEIAYNEVTYKLPTFEYRVAQRAKALPKIQFKKIDKKINIFEEAWGEIETQESSDEAWREIRGDVAIPAIQEFESQKIDSLLMEGEKLAALFDGFKYEEKKTLIAQSSTEVLSAPEVALSNPTKPNIVQDSVSTIAAKSVEEDLEFFSYEEKIEEPKIDKKQVEAQVPTVIEKIEYSPTPEPVVSEVAKVEVEKENLEFFNLIQETQMPAATTKKAANKPVAKPTIKPAVASHPARKPESETNAFMSSHNALTVVHGISVSSQVSDLRYFDLRAVDDGQTIISDNGSGNISLKENIRSNNNSRSFLLLNRDHVVTHVDVPFAPGRTDLGVPALEKDFAEKYQVRNQKQPRGMVLVELDEKTENIVLDGAKFKNVFLNEKFKESSIEHASYVLFFGVEVGNRTMTVTDSRGKQSVRVIHVFEDEVTFDANLYLPASDLVVSLKEEGVMSQTSRPLSVSAEDVSLTFTNTKSERLSTNSYKLKAPSLLMGSRHYLTLSHQREEIFVGVDESKTVHVPSEELINTVIRKFKLQGHASACLIQVNLDRPAKKYDIMAESHQETHVSYALVLDKDGGFYESMSEDSKKIFIMSESQAGDAFTQNAKINIKIEFLDGTTQSFSSFCSPNTYLVEQL